MSQAFGAWLQKEMTRVELNMVGLAAKMYLAHTSVRAWLEGTAEPKPANARRLAVVLGVPIEDVYGALGRVDLDREYSDSVNRMAAKMERLSEADQLLFERMLDELVERLGSSQAPDAPVGGED